MNHIPPPLPPPQHWWQRDWLWAAPIGCTMLLFCVAVLIGGTFVGVMGFIKSSAPYRISVLRAGGNAQVDRALGSPITEGWFITGGINVSGTSGHAKLAIPIAGPKGKATIYVAANKTKGTWVYSTLKVFITGTNEVIDLHEEGIDP